MMPRLTYFKRYRMEVNVTHPLPDAALPEGFAFVPWDDDRSDSHAETLFDSFRDEVDSQLFPSFQTAFGCRDLMAAIRNRPGFCPQATWLVAAPDGDLAGTVQGLRDKKGLGAVQNIGVVPEYRGLGLGAAILARSLAGFRAAGASRVYLEVTAQNDAAVRLYRRFGFRSVRTIYKAVAAAPAPVGAGI